MASASATASPLRQQIIRFMCGPRYGQCSARTDDDTKSSASAAVNLVRFARLPGSSRRRPVRGATMAHSSGPGRWHWDQHWRDVLFLHWPLAPAALLEHVPARLQLDTWGGRAWITLVL